MLPSKKFKMKQKNNHVTLPGIQESSIILFDI